MFHRLNDKVDNSLTEIPGCPEKRIVKLKQYRSCNHCILFLWTVFRRRNVVMGIDVRWVSRGRRDVVSYHKWMTSHNFFDFGVTCSTFISLCPNIRNTGLYFYLAFDFFKLRKNGENVFSQGPK